MKRYLLFYGMIYYPSGGAEDFLSAHDTLEEAKAAGTAKIQEEGSGNWANIFDNELRGVVSEFLWGYHGDDTGWEDVPLSIGIHDER